MSTEILRSLARTPGFVSFLENIVDDVKTGSSVVIILPATIDKIAASEFIAGVLWNNELDLRRSTLPKFRTPEHRRSRCSAVCSVMAQWRVQP